MKYWDNKGNESRIHTLAAAREIDKSGTRNNEQKANKSSAVTL